MVCGRHISPKNVGGIPTFYYYSTQTMKGSGGIWRLWAVMGDTLVQNMWGGTTITHDHVTNCNEHPGGFSKKVGKCRKKYTSRSVTILQLPRTSKTRSHRWKALAMIRMSSLASGSPSPTANKIQCTAKEYYCSMVTALVTVSTFGLEFRDVKVGTA